MEENWERVQTLAGRLLDRLEQATEELDRGTVTQKEKKKTEDGEQLREVTKPWRKGVVDRGGLKQLTGVLKDLQDILSWDGSLNVREREAKIHKLEQELNRDPASETITVVLEKEAQDYAD